MASFTLQSVANVFPVGTSVGAHLARYRRNGSSPTGSATATATVAADGTLTFSGVSDDTDYVAYASVSDVHRYINFQTTRPRYTGLEIVGPLTDGSAPVWSESDDALVAQPVANRDEAPPNVLYFMESGPDGVTSDSAAIDLAVAEALSQGHERVTLPATENAWRITKPLPKTVVFETKGRTSAGTRVKALAPFVGPAMVDVGDTAYPLRAVGSLRLDCNMIPGLSAIAGANGALGSYVGSMKDIHIISCAPGPVALLAEEVTLGGTVTFDVAYDDSAMSLEDAFRGGYLKFAGSATSPVITGADNDAQTITVSGGSGTFAAGVAIERPTYALETEPYVEAGSGAFTGWVGDSVLFSNCAHLIRLPSPAGDDLATVGFRSTTVETAGASTTLAANFDADNDDTVSVASATNLRSAGRVVIGSDAVWYTGKSGNTLTGVYTAATGVINSGTAVAQYNRPIDAILDLDAVNMRFDSVYTALGRSDAVQSGGVAALARFGGQDIKFDGWFVETPGDQQADFTHLVHFASARARTKLDGLTLNLTNIPSMVALFRTQLGTPMAASQRKYLRVERAVYATSDDDARALPIVDVFVGSDAVSNGNVLDLEVHGCDDMDKIGRFGASSTTGTTGVVRLTGLWRGRRLDDNLACLTANADFPELIHHLVQDASTSPEGAVTARLGSTLTVRNFASSSFAAFFRKVAQSGANLWVGELFGTGTPSSSPPTGSRFTDTTLGSLWLRYASAWRFVQPESYFANSSDADATLTPFTSARTQVYTGTLTADRTVTLSTTNAVAGMTFRVVRTGAGAFNLNVGSGPLKALAQNTWCEVTYNGSAWVLTAYGAL